MSDADRERRRRQIIDAVVRITTSGGLQAASFRTIANEAGVSVRLVQYYFGTKDQLLADTLAEARKDAVARIQRALEALGPEPTAKERIRTIFEQLLPLDEPRRRAMLVFIAFRTAALTDSTLGSSDTLGLDTSLIDNIRDAIEEAAATGKTREGMDSHHEAVMLVTAMTGIANGMLSGAFDEEEGRDSLEYVLDLTIPGEG
jgi:TetR/AcrR family transcriptional repressor of bet genes